MQFKYKSELATINNRADKEEKYINFLRLRSTLQNGDSVNIYV